MDLPNELPIDSKPRLDRVRLIVVAMLVFDTDAELLGNHTLVLLCQACAVAEALRRRLGDTHRKMSSSTLEAHGT